MYVRAKEREDFVHGGQGRIKKVKRKIAAVRGTIPLAARDAADEYMEKLLEIQLRILAPQPLKEEKRKLKQIASGLEAVIKAFQAGYNLTTPNPKWFCGLVRGGSVKLAPGPLDSQLAQAPGLFPTANPLDQNKQKVWVFRGVIPPAVQEEYLKAVKIFGENHIQVYSSHKEDFEELRLRPDPVMIGIVEDVVDHGNLFFEIASWDTVRDLEVLHLFEKK